MNSRRLPQKPGEWIDRTKKVEFYFEGKKIVGYKGDVITSALVASGHSILARSFKYHRPRGVLSLANHDANILLETKEKTNIRADVTLPIEGQEYKVVNTFGGLKLDFARVLQCFSVFLPVGFYYKAFYRPRFLFPYWEKIIRQLAGLGKIGVNHDKSRFPTQRLFCDVLIVGAGASGLSAAAQLLGTGLKVVIADENAEFGGTSSFTGPENSEERVKVKNLLKQIKTSPFLLLKSHFAAGFYADKTIPLVGTNGIYLVHANAVIVTTGAYEQPAVFRNNDLPGIVLSSAVSRLVHRYSVCPFSNALMLAGNKNAYEVALNLAANGMNISTILDLGQPTERGDLPEKATAAGISIIPNVTSLEAIGGRGKFTELRYRLGKDIGEKRLSGDGLIMSVGWNPAANLLSQAGSQMVYSDEQGQLSISKYPEGVFAAGRVRGVFPLGDRLSDGAAAGDACENYLKGSAREFIPKLPTARESHPFPIMPHKKGKEFVDFDEDLVIKDIKTAVKEGFDSAELLKRYSTIGMGPSQGKTSNINGARIMARLRQKPVASVGLTTVRPFVHPVAIGLLAGRRIRKQKRTPLDQYHRTSGADMKEAGAWVRPMSYKIGTPINTILDEYKSVRNDVGVIDVSTLGKIDIFGPDASELMAYTYTCNFDKLRKEMTRYVFMVDAGGTLIDDGVAAKLSDHHYYVTTTTTHSQMIVRQLHLYASQLKLEVEIVDRTASVAAINLAGPRSMELLTNIADIDLDGNNFPYLGFKEGSLSGVAARLMRVGFVGELGYEIHLPANSLAIVWKKIVTEGKKFGIKPFGVEAQRLLRLEKGHLIFGQDTDGNTNPYEVGLGWGVSLKKNRFHGKHSLQVLKDSVKRKIVGIKCGSENFDRILENHLLIDNSKILGRITSIGYSPATQSTIGLAMLDENREVGETVIIRGLKNESIEADIVETPFYDPDNNRQKI